MACLPGALSQWALIDRVEGRAVTASETLLHELAPILD